MLDKVKMAGALIIFKGRVLIFHEDAKPYWDLPKGKMEDGETPWDTALREVWEETNIVLDKDNVRLLGEFKVLPSGTISLYKTELKDSPKLEAHMELLDDVTPPVEFKWILPEHVKQYLKEDLSDLVTRNI